MGSPLAGGHEYRRVGRGAGLVFSGFNAGVGNSGGVRPSAAAPAREEPEIFFRLFSCGLSRRYGFVIGRRVFSGRVSNVGQARVFSCFFPHTIDHHEKTMYTAKYHIVIAAKNEARRYEIIA